MEDWSDTPIYAQMMAEKREREMLEAERVLNPIYVQVIEETKKREKLMEAMQKMVVAMREAMDLPISPVPRTLSPEEAKLHIKMIRDEFEEEFVPAFLEQDLVEMYDAGIDVLVYVIGALTHAGFDIEPGFREIMRSNMSKFDPETGKAIKAGPNDPDGHPEGKVLKGPAYSPPNLAPIINETFVYGPEDSTVYNTKKTPITLGVGGPKIGEGDLHMDNNGNVEMQGVIFDVDVLPQIQSFSILDTHIEHVDEVQEIALFEDVEDYVIKGHAPVPEDWPQVINIDEISPAEMYSDALKEPGVLTTMTESRLVEIVDEEEALRHQRLKDSKYGIAYSEEAEYDGNENGNFESLPRRSSFINIDKEDDK